MTWGEFKAQVEAQGVKDDDELSYVDFSFAEKVEVHHDGEWIAIEECWS